MSPGVGCVGCEGSSPPPRPSATLCELMRLPPPVSQNDDTALILAAWEGHLPVVQTLLGADADISAKNKVRGWPPVCMGWEGRWWGGGQGGARGYQRATCILRS